MKPLTAWLTGIAYASAPALLTFIYAGHEAKMLVIGLFPLMVWGLYRGMETGRPIYYLVLSVAIGAGIYTPHLQMLYYALCGLGIIFTARLAQFLYGERDIAAALRQSLLSAGAVCLGLGIGAMGVFPQYWYTRTESRRALGGGEGKGLEYAQTWSLHPEEVGSLLVPEFAHFDDPDRRQRNYWGRNAILNSIPNISASPFSSSPRSPWGASAATRESGSFFCSFSSPWRSLSDPIPSCMDTRIDTFPG